MENHISTSFNRTLSIDPDLEFNFDQKYPIVDPKYSETKPKNKTARNLLLTYFTTVFVGVGLVIGLVMVGFNQHGSTKKIISTG